MHTQPYRVEICARSLEDAYESFAQNLQNSHFRWNQLHIYLSLNQREKQDNTTINKLNNCIVVISTSSNKYYNHLFKSNNNIQANVNKEAC